MLFRSMLLAVALVLPAAALAEDVTPTSDPAAQTAQPDTGTSDQSGVDPTIYQNQAPTSQGSASTLLGPQAGASSTTDGASLQPAGAANSPLQSTTNDSAGLTAPSGSQLQGAAPTDAQLQVLNGEVDGERQSSGASETTGNSLEASALDTLAIGLLLGLMAMVLILRQRTVRRFGT